LDDGQCGYHQIEKEKPSWGCQFSTTLLSEKY
jgi:hypothetical protein